MTIRIIIFIHLIFVLQDLVNGQSAAPVIPKPQKMELAQGVFKITPATSILSQKELLTRAKQLKGYLEPALGYDLAVNPKSGKKKCHQFKT